MKRETREAEVNLEIDFEKRKEFQINTPLAFFNHMVETLAWNACMNIKLDFKAKTYPLAHVITEDCGLLLGKALLEQFKEKEGNGFAIRCIDEAQALAVISIEGRANSYFDFNNKDLNLKKVDDTLGADLKAFIDGLAQGLKATIQVKILQGEDPHHLWEAVFRSLGIAIRQSFQKNNWRPICGVKGTLE
jgi:imidazoleglycerol-phosphate dehydratase